MSTFGVGQIIVSAGKTAIFPNNAKMWEESNHFKDIRSIPSSGIGSTAVTVNILSMDTVCGAPASAPESDGSFVGLELDDLLHLDLVVENDTTFLLIRSFHTTNY